MHTLRSEAELADTRTVGDHDRRELAIAIFVLRPERRDAHGAVLAVPLANRSAAAEALSGAVETIVVVDRESAGERELIAERNSGVELGVARREGP